MSNTDDELEKILAEFTGNLDVITYHESALQTAKQAIKELITKARLRGYNSGWVAASRVKPEKFAYFAKQLEDSAKKLRNMEAQLKGDK